jgi:ABC-type Fe3+ transport system permease subunit
MTLLATAGESIMLASCATLIALPLAFATGWSAAAPGSFATACRRALRFLASLPIALIGLVSFTAAPFLPTELAVLAALAIGAYAPIAVAVSVARTGQGLRPERDALALGLSRRAVMLGVVLPVLRAPVSAAVLRTLGRLVGETGLFLLIAIAPGAMPSTLGASVLHGALRGDRVLPSLLVLMLVPVALALFAERVERRGRA